MMPGTMSHRPHWTASTAFLRKRRLARWALMLLLLLGFARLAQVELHEPMLGYANNYDFIKISSTVGLWAEEPGVNPYEGHPSAPVRHYRSHGPRYPEARYLSSELLLVYPAIAVADLRNVLREVSYGTFDLRTLGIVKSFFFLAAGTFLSILFFRRSPRFGLFCAGLFAALICDPLNSLYFNTLYFDDSAVFFGFLSVGLAVYLIFSEQQSTPLVVAFCLSLVLLAVSKMQHAGLPLAIALAFCAGRARESWKAGRQRAVLKACAPVLFISLFSLWLGIVNKRAPSMHSMVKAAATDSWFGMVLPALKDPAGALRALNVPERCAAFVGKTWYSPGMNPSPCPEIFALSRFQMVALLVKEPSALWRILKKAIPDTRPLFVFYGQVEGSNYGRLSDRGSRLRSWVAWLDQLSTPAYVLLFGGCCLVGFLSLLLLIGGRRDLLLSFCVILNAVVAATFMACLLGDGYADLARHFHLGQNALLAACVASVTAVGRGLRDWIATGPGLIAKQGWSERTPRRT